MSRKLFKSLDVINESIWCAQQVKIDAGMKTQCTPPEISAEAFGQNRFSKSVQPGSKIADERVQTDNNPS